MMDLRKTISAIAVVVGLFATSSAMAASDVSREDKVKARKKLEQLAREAKQAAAASRAAADSIYTAAQAAYEEADYVKAVELLEKALSIDPNHSGANTLATTVRAILSRGNDRFKTALSNLGDIRRVQVQNSLVMLTRAKAYAREHLMRAEKVQDGDDQRSPELLYSRKINDLEQAIEKYTRAREIIRWMPYVLELENEAKEIDGQLAKAKMLMAQNAESLRVEKRRVAAARAKESRKRESDTYRQHVAKLYSAAKMEFEKGNYEEAERACQRILNDNPTNRDAQSLMSKCRSKKHQKTATILEKRYEEEKRRTFQDVDEALIPLNQLINFPSNWREIRKRSLTAGAIDMTQEPEWSQSIKLGLDSKVNFEFSETPLLEAIQFLQTLTDINVIVDTQLDDSVKQTPITLRVSNMSLGLALDWILRIVDLKYVIKDHALFISRAENIMGDVVLRMYDVRDLTARVSSYPGPELMLTLDSSDEGGGILIDDFGDDSGDVVTANDLADMIMQRINPSDWGAELGTSIEERDGKLVVMQRPEVHRLIDHLLESFRSAQKLFVVVEGRFLELRESFFEESGIDFGGPMVANADADDYLPNRNLSALPDTTNVDISSDTLTDADYSSMAPGVIASPTDANIFGHGDLHVVGTVSNYRPNAAPEMTENAPTAGEENLGLNMQIRKLGDLEVMAFLHALNKRTGWSSLMAPKLTVMNTQRAHMFVAEQRSYVSDYEVQSNKFDPVISYFLQGIVFDVKPIVSADRKYVTLEVQPTVATLSDMPQYEILALAFFGLVYGTLHYSLDAPELALHRIKTTVTIPDGGIMFIGGMMRNIKFQGENGVPFLSNLPVVGKLFRWNITDNERSNLSVLVTARILMFDEEESKL